MEWSLVGIAFVCGFALRAFTHGKAPLAASEAVEVDIRRHLDDMVIGQNFSTPEIAEEIRRSRIVATNTYTITVRRKDGSEEDFENTVYFAINADGIRFVFSPRGTPTMSQDNTTPYGMAKAGTFKGGDQAGDHALEWVQMGKLPPRAEVVEKHVETLVAYLSAEILSGSEKIEIPDY